MFRVRCVYLIVDGPKFVCYLENKNFVNVKNSVSLSLLQRNQIYDNG